MRAIALSLTLLPSLLLPARAGQTMESASNKVHRNAVTAGGQRSTSSNNVLTSAVGEEAGASSFSSGHRLSPGAMALFSYPGRITDLTSTEQFLTSATMRWSTPGYDGGLSSTLQPGSSYYIRITSYTVPDTFAQQQNSELWIATHSTLLAGTLADLRRTGLDPNTTWYAEVWTADNDGNIGFSSNRSTFTSLARAPTALPQAYLYVFDTSATLNWAALPSSPASESSQGYVLEASTTNFGALLPGGATLSSTTYNVAASTLTLDNLDLGSTYYFRVGSLNWAGRPNYLDLPKLNFQLEQSSTSLSFGSIDARVVESVISASSIVVVNRGNLPMTLRLFAGTATSGSPWTLSTSSAVETAVVQAVWNTVQPSGNAFQHAVTASTTTSGGMSGTYAGDQAGASIPAGATRTLWFRFWRPTTTVATTQQLLRVDIRAAYP